MANALGHFLYFFPWILLTLPLTVPGIKGQFTGWEDYINSWNGEAAADKMFPYGEVYHDQSLAAPTLGTDMAIDFTIPFHGRLFSSAFLDVDGHIELSNTVPATHTYKPKKTEWPNDNYPAEGDPPFIAPYIADFDLTGLPMHPGQLYWRLLDPFKETDESRIEIVGGMLNHLSLVVQQQVLGAEDFTAQYGLVATWSMMTYQGCNSEQCPINSVQAVVLTDDIHTYAIFNYYDLNWVGGILQGYDGDNGRDCLESCRPAQAGFNAGEAQSFLFLPYSNTDNILKLAQIGGRFVYGIHSVNVHRGGCTNQTDVDPLDWPLVVNPNRGTMLGGQAIHVSGPCFFPHIIPSVQCKFGDIVVEGHILDDDVIRALCVTPLVMHTGLIRVQLSTDQGATWPYTGWFTYDIPSIDIPTLHLDHPEQWHLKAVDTLAFDWEPLSLDDDSMFRANVTPGESNVDVRLFGFFETEAANGTSGELRELHVLEEDIENTGRYEFTPSDHGCPGAVDCEWGIPLPVGLMEVRRRGSGATPRRLWSSPFPLGWYGNGAWEEERGPEWADEMCQWWLDCEETDTSWKDDLQPCPMSRSHAAADMGQFMLGYDCNATWPICPKLPDESPEQMITCYDQVMPHSQKWPSISRCCYDQYGYLLYSGDSAHPENSSPSVKASPRGSPRATHGKVPMLSHYCWDKVFQTLCCEWTSDPRFCQDGFMKHRPTADMLMYVPPKFTTTFGDPHFRTYDGVEYTFNGRGEYWLLRIHDVNDLDNFNIQARMESPRNQTWGEIQGTVMTVIAMQEGYADSMTVPIIEVAAAHAPATTDLVLLIDSKPYDLAGEPTGTLLIPYMDNSRHIMVINNEVTPHPGNRQSNITVVFQAGITVQVAFKDMAIHVITGLPEMYKGKTGGLFGLWNDNMDDDLTAPSGSIIDPSSSNEVIHNQFGQTWIIDPTESRLTYRGQMDFGSFYDPDFVPHFEEPVLPPSSPISEADVDEACQNNFVCRFDYKTTMSRDLAITSANMEAWSREIVNISAPVPVCSRLEVTFSRREVTHYMVGGTVNFLGCTDGYTLEGPSLYTCVEYQEGAAEWQPILQTICRANSDIQNENKKKIIAIVVPIVVVCVAVGLGVGGYFIHKKRKKNAMADQASYPGPRHRPPSLDATTLEVNFNPVPIQRPPNENRLVSQGLNQASTLAGSGALGSLDSFTASDRIDTRMRSPSPDDSNSFGPDFTQSSAPVGYSSNPNTHNNNPRSLSVNHVHLQNNYNNNIENANSEDSHDYDSREFEPSIATLSHSQVSINYQPERNHMQNNQHNQSSQSLNRSRPSLHQSTHSLNASRASLAQSKQSGLNQSVHLIGSSHNLSLHDPLNQYVNLAHASSVHSISQSEAPQYRSHTSLNKSYTGYVNNGLEADDTPRQAVPASNFAAYTGGFGTDTTV